MQLNAEWEGETKAVRTLFTPPFIEKPKQILLTHGCTIQEQGKGCIITFPEGTTRTLLYPQMVHARYRIVLPDGVELREVEDRFTEKSLLSVDLDTLPDSEKGIESHE